MASEKKPGIGHLLAKDLTETGPTLSRERMA